jgi:hypothetical protein
MLDREEDEDESYFEIALSDKLDKLIPQRCPSHITNAMLRRRMLLLRAEFMGLLGSLKNEELDLDKMVNASITTAKCIYDF